MNSRMRLAASSVVAVAVMVAGATAAAAGEAEKVKSNVKITDGGPNGAEGTVGSRERKCERRRKVTLYYLGASSPGLYRGGLHLAGDDRQKVGSDQTNRKGRWEVEEELIAGDYQAKVSRERVDNAEDLLCKVDLSVVVRL